MRLQEAQKIQGIVNDLRIKGIPENTVKEIVDRMFPAVPETKKTTSIHGERKAGRRHGNNQEFLDYFSKENGYSVQEFIEQVNRNSLDSKTAEKAVLSAISWLRARSSKGTDTFEQNAAFSNYLENILNGSNKVEEKMLTRIAMKEIGSAYQIFDGNLKIRKWYLTQTPDFVAFLNSLNLL